MDGQRLSGGPLGRVERRYRLMIGMDRLVKIALVRSGQVFRDQMDVTDMVGDIKWTSICVTVFCDAKIVIR